MINNFVIIITENEVGHGKDYFLQYEIRTTPLVRINLLLLKNLSS